MTSAAPAPSAGRVERLVGWALGPEELRPEVLRPEVLRPEDTGHLVTVVTDTLAAVDDGLAAVRSAPDGGHGHTANHPRADTPPAVQAEAAAAHEVAVRFACRPRLPVPVSGSAMACGAAAGVAREGRR